jgi:hypothetical protein
VWRDRLLAAMHFLADGEAEVPIEAGDARFAVATWPLTAPLPVSYEATDAPLPTEEDEEGNIVPTADEGEACCAAQMFLNSGNGVVFRGALGPWYSAKNREFHLRRDAAQALVGQVIDAYRKEHGAPPEELFIHGRHRFSMRNGRFRAVIPTETKKFVGVRIPHEPGLRLFRPNADVPVLRGTAVTMSNREGYLWTTGYIPRLRPIPALRRRNPFLSIAARAISRP